MALKNQNRLVGGVTVQLYTDDVKRVGSGVVEVSGIRVVRGKLWRSGGVAYCKSRGFVGLVGFRV